MTKFNEYARKLNDAAKAAFIEYREAEAAYKRAEAKAKEYTNRSGYVSSEYAAKAARARADFVEAKESYITAKRVFENSGRQLSEIRSELESAINEAYMADPAQLDGNTLELLKSGVLKSSEYSKLLNDARTTNNPTMVRMIGKYADNAAKSRSIDYGQNDSEAAALRMVAHNSKTYTGADRLEAFDTMVSVDNRCTKNPAMIDKWDFLLSETIEKF